MSKVLYPDLGQTSIDVSGDEEIDGRTRLIDLVLGYKEDGNQENQQKRTIFQQNLMASGLQLQEEKGKTFEEDAMMYLKIHAPESVLVRQADILAMKKSVKLLLEKPPEKNSSLVPKFMKPKLTKDSRCLKAAFREDISDVFLAEGETISDIFSSGDRTAVVWDILLKTRFGEIDKELGIHRLLSNGAYTAAYPLHEGPFLKSEAQNNNCNVCFTDRQVLYDEWARPSSWYKTQPLDLVRTYFGDEIGIYFAWLGFYTTMLIPASIVGLICFIYGLASVGTNFNTPSKEICDTSPGKPGSYIICASCKDGACPYEVLGDSCAYSQLSYLFDNPATVAFAIFMSFWATMFLELWKRQQARLVSLWGLTETQLDMETRPEYDAMVNSVTTTRVNSLTGKTEQALSTWNQAFRFATAASGVAIMIAVVIIAFIAIIVYKIAVAAAFYAIDDTFFKDNSQILTTTTAAVINLIIILLLGLFYRKVAKWLTDMECLRTQTDYDNSFTFKIFIFEFMNCYSLLIYIAFFKGKFYTYPGDDSMWTTFFGIGGDQCDTAGCISELFIQLITIMVGKQVFNNFTEIALPMLKRRLFKTDEKVKSSDPQWEQDIHLSPVENLTLFNEVLEMVLQYGFITLFVACFPLAPLFALLNNIIEIRVDAFKMIVQQRRPVPKRAASLGAWLKILQTITFLAVVFNAFVIAYASEFIPQVVYMITKSTTGGLEGYVDFTLSKFLIKDYGVTSEEHPSDTDVCYYRGFRASYTEPDKYTVTSDYWNVLAARLAFVVVFEHVVMGLTGLLAAVIPDLPWEVREKEFIESKLLAEQTLLYKTNKRSKTSI